jgi:hypothetical protein
MLATMSFLETLHTYLEIAESLAATCAILAGAWWFFARRESVRKANVAHHINFADAGKWVYVGVQLTIKNTGRRRIVSEAVEPDPNRPLDQLGNVVIVEEVSPFLGRTEISSQEFSPEFNLQFLGLRSLPGKIVIEPDEEQTILLDFIVPKSTRTIKVYSHIDNAYNKDNGWNTATIHNVNLETTVNGQKERKK